MRFLSLCWRGENGEVIMKITFFVIYSAIILFVSCEKKENTNLEYDNTAEIVEYKNNEQIHNTENLNLEKPVVIEIDGKARFLEFSNSRKLDIDEYVIRTSFQTIAVYDNASEEADYEIINYAFGVLLFSLPETEDWFYLYTPDIHGFVNVYDFPRARRTNGWLSINNDNENAILRRLPNSRRYGPLLEIHYNNNIKKIWDYYDDEMGHRSYGLLNYYEEYDEIFIGRYDGGSDMAFFIYNMQLDTISELVNWPVYNNSRDMALCYDVQPSKTYGINLCVYRIEDGIYEKITDKILFQGNRNINVGATNWINDNEFKIELRDRENTTEEKSVIGRKNGLTFDLIYNE